MNVYKILLLLVALLFAAITNVAQERITQEQRVIRGKVKPDKLIQCNNRTIDWSNITVKVRGDGQPVDPYPASSKGEDWSHTVNVGATVRVAFFRICYGSARLTPHVVSAAESQSLEDAVMYSEYYCNSCSAPTPTPTPQQKAQTTASTAEKEPTASGSTITVMGHPDFKEATAQPVQRTKPTAEQLRARLKQDAEIALEFDALDIFQYNFEAAFATLSDDADLKAVLDGFRNDTRNAAVFRSTGSGGSAVYRNLIRSQMDEKTKLDFALMTNLVRDKSIDHSIRGSAVVALLDSDLSARQKAVVRYVLRPNLNNTSDGLYLTSVIALARLGDPRDRSRIGADINSPDTYRAQAALTAIRITQIMEGPNTFAFATGAVQNQAKTNNDAGVRLAAIRALRPSAFYRRLGTVIDTLSDVLKDDDDELVRAEAAAALGLGKLECRADVNESLTTAQQNDTSDIVKVAADNALKVVGDFQPVKCRRSWSAAAIANKP